MTQRSYSLIIVFAELLFLSSTGAFVQSPLSSISSAISFRSFSAHNLATRFYDYNDANDNYPFHQRVHLFESILRDGEQGARKTLTPEQKGCFARKLEEELGANVVIDAGLPGASPLDFSGVQNVVRNTHRSILSTLAHGTPTEIAVASRALRGAEERSRISTFHRPMELSTRYNNHNSCPGSSNSNSNSNSSIRNRLLKQARRAVSIAADVAPQVQYYLVYAGNRDPNFLAELAQVVSEAGATHVVIADSQSALTPSKAHKLTLRIKEALGDERTGTTIGIHCHNQMGLALPNTLAAIRAGATQVESCLVGVGDAGGNLATEQFLAYCEHSRSVLSASAAASDVYLTDDLFPSSCSVIGDCSVPASVTLAKEVAQMMNFNIGENQPIIGERAFTCTTGIHQDNMDHLGHTTFQPKIVGREWSVALNRHSSRKTVQTFLSKNLESISTNTTVSVSAGTREDLADAIYSYLSDRVDVVDEESILSFCSQLLEAHVVLRNRGVVICPTTVGYTLVTTRNAAKMKSIKGRPDDKPCGILGIDEIYKATFGTDPPLKRNRFVNRHIVGYLGKPRGVGKVESCTKHLPKDAIDPKSGRVGIWLECGPVVDYLAKRFWSESREIIVATSCNMAGEGNPRSNHYDLSYIDSSVRSKADFEVSLPHWESPDLDENGRWLSAPIWNLEKEVFIREGRNQKAVESMLLEEEEEEEQQQQQQQEPGFVVEKIQAIEISKSKRVDALNNSTRVFASSMCWASFL